MLARRLVPLALVAASLAVAGCGTERTAAQVERAEEGGAGSSQAAGGTAAIDALVRTAGTDVERAPGLARTGGAPPTTLVNRDVVPGKGGTAKPGDTVQVRYTLAFWGRGKVQSTWDMGNQPIPLTLQQGAVIPAFVRGVPGMKVGGRRVIVAPPALAYGAAGGQGIPPNTTLVFIVDLAAIGGSATGGGAGSSSGSGSGG